MIPWNYKAQEARKDGVQNWWKYFLEGYALTPNCGFGFGHFTGCYLLPLGSDSLPFGLYWVRVTLLTMWNGNGCLSVLEWDVDICLIAGSGGHKANVTTITFYIADLKNVQLLFYSPLQNWVCTSFSSVVVMFIYKYTHTMNPLTMMLLKMVENSVWNLEKVLHNFFPQTFQLMQWNILFSLHDLPWIYSCSICTHTTYLISLMHSSHKESFNLNGFTLTFLATQIRVPHTQRCVCIVSVPCTLTWTKWCTENYFLYTLCRVSIK